MSLLISFLVLGQGIVVGDGGGQNRATASLDNYYNARREVTFSGVVAGKTKGTVPGKAEGMSILVRSGKTIREVELGPAWYVGRQAASVNLGDKVKVTATPLIVDKRSKVFLARQLVRGKAILTLRDRMGRPYWSARRDPVARRNANGRAQGMGSMYEGTVASMTTFDINGESYSGYVLNTANGPVNVAMAPTWYWNNQPNTLNVGTQVSLLGNGPARNFSSPGVTVGRGGGLNRLGGNGTGVVLVNSATYGGNTYDLRPGGIPVYGGFRNLP